MEKCATCLFVLMSITANWWSVHGDCSQEHATCPEDTGKAEEQRKAQAEPGSEQPQRWWWWWALNALMAQQAGRTQRITGLPQCCSSPKIWQFPVSEAHRSKPDSYFSFVSKHAFHGMFSESFTHSRLCTVHEVDPLGWQMVLRPPEQGEWPWPVCSSPSKGRNSNTWYCSSLASPL